MHVDYVQHKVDKVEHIFNIFSDVQSFIGGDMILKAVKHRTRRVLDIFVVTSLLAIMSSPELVSK